ncbi:MAG: hypothetical protein COB88_06820 [Flavobacteriales bacterium]|nr:MAG: hypothetical protein COB88_06820 [Flavobacteriales bacterium]
MRTLITAIFLFNVLTSFGQKLTNKISDDICNCINKVKIDTLNSPNAATEFQNCFGKIVYYAGDLKKRNIDIQVPSDLDSVSEIIVTRLMKTCDNYLRLVTFFSRTSPDTTSFKIIDSTTCRIVRNGKFESLNTKETMITIMKENEQTVEYPDKKFYSKSKVTWVNDCEYILTFEKSTNPDIDKFYKKGDETRIKLLEIDGNIITFWMNSKGLEYIGQMKKIE